MLDDLAMHITGPWYSIGLKLGLSSARLDGIIANNVQYPRPAEKAFQMLKIWKDKGSSATNAKLADALRKLNMDRLAEMYC